MHSTLTVALALPCVRVRWVCATAVCACAGKQTQLVRAATKLHPRTMPKLRDVTWEIKPGNALAVCAALAPFDFAHILNIATKRFTAATVQMAAVSEWGEWGCNSSRVPSGEDVWWTMETMGMPRLERRGVTARALPSMAARRGGISWRAVGRLSTLWAGSLGEWG